MTLLTKKRNYFIREVKFLVCIHNLVCPKFLRLSGSKILYLKKNQFLTL